MASKIDHFEGITERSGPAPVIRKLWRDDMAAVVSLDAHATGVAKPEYWAETFKRFVPPTAQRCAFAAEQDGALVGYVMGEIRSWEFGSPPCGWVFAINVSPEAREAGIGSQLLDAARASFRKAGIKSLRTMVARDATLMLSFFRAQGMTAGPFVELEMPIDSNPSGTSE
jgi:ribosomal protein S18 acetylase RimI-like enzyme